MARKKSQQRKKRRVEFRKKHDTRTRQNDLTREVQREEESAADGGSSDLAADERMSGKGDLSRYRTIVGVTENAAGELIREVDDENCLDGRVVSAIGLNSMVRSGDGTLYECAVRRVLRDLARDARNAIVTGDRVKFLPTGEILPSGLPQGVVERIESRHGVISRVSGHREHILVANTDQVVIVASAADPPLKPGLIDRFLVSAEKGEVGAVVCINKLDLIDPAGIASVVQRYERLGYPVICTSVENGAGLEELKSQLDGRQSVFAGQSGVGKSSLLNAVQPGWSLQTGEVSGWTRKGKHTTRRAVLLEFGEDGWVVDTPGIRQFALWDVDPAEVEAYFVEFPKYVADCKYPDCSHTHEDNCSVKQAVTDGHIDPVRYESYVRIYHDDVDV